LRLLDRALDRGLKLVQVRDKSLPPAERKKFAARVIERARRKDAKVLLNSDLALARELSADGVHYTAAGLMSLDEKPAGLLAAASCHTSGELAQAERLGLDFAVLGSINPTTSHPGAAVLGWTGFAQIGRGAGIPVFAIGGVNREDMEQGRAAGAHGLAMIRGAWNV